MSGSSNGRTAGFQSACRSSILLLDTVKSGIGVGDGMSGFQPEGESLTLSFRSKGQIGYWPATSLQNWVRKFDSFFVLEKVLLAQVVRATRS